MNDGNRALSERGAERAARGSARRAYRRLLGYLAPYRGRFILGLLGGALFSASMVSFAYFMTRFGEGTLVHQDPATIVWVPVALVGLFLVRGLGDFTQTYFMGYVGRHIVSELRAEVFRHVLRLPVGYFDRSSSGNLLSRLTYNSELVGQATTDSVSMLLRTALTIIGSVGYLLYLNVRLALIALMVGPLMGWLVSVINRLFRRYSRRIQDSMGDVTRVAKESFEAPRLIKLYNAEDHLGRQFDAVNAHNLRSNMKLILTRGVSNPVVQMLAALGGAFVLSIAIADAIHGRMNMGELLGFITALVGIAQPLRDLVGVAGPLQQGIAAGQSLFEVLDEPLDPPGGTFPPRGRTARCASSRCRSRIRPAPRRRTVRWRRAAGRQRCRTSRSRWPPGRAWRSSDARAAASRRWSTCCRASTTSAPAACASTAATCATMTSPTCANRSRW